MNAYDENSFAARQTILLQQFITKLSGFKAEEQKRCDH